MAHRRRAAPYVVRRHGGHHDQGADLGHADLGHANLIDVDLTGQTLPVPISPSPI
jgi:hypothetical protein